MNSSRQQVHAASGGLRQEQKKEKNKQQNQLPQNIYSQHSQYQFPQNPVPHLQNQFPPNQYPQYNQNQYQQTQFPQNQYPPNQFLQNQYPPNQYPQNLYLPNQFPQNLYSPNRFHPNQLSQNQFPQNHSPQNQYPQQSYPGNNYPVNKQQNHFQQNQHYQKYSQNQQQLNQPSSLIKDTEKKNPLSKKQRKHQQQQLQLSKKPKLTRKQRHEAKKQRKQQKENKVKNTDNKDIKMVKKRIVNIPKKPCFGIPYEMNWPCLQKFSIKLILDEIKSVFGNKLCDQYLLKKRLKLKSRHPDKSTDEINEILHTVAAKRNTYKDKDVTTLVKALDCEDKIQSIGEYFVIGINKVSKYFEKQEELELVLVCQSADPKLMTQHLLCQSVLSNTTACCIARLSENLQDLLDISSILAIGFKKVQNNPFEDLINFIRNKLPTDKIPDNHISSILSSSENTPNSSLPAGIHNTNSPANLSNSNLPANISNSNSPVEEERVNDVEQTLVTKSRDQNKRQNDYIETNVILIAKKRRKRKN